MLEQAMAASSFAETVVADKRSMFRLPTMVSIQLAIYIQPLPIPLSPFRFSLFLFPYLVPPPSKSPIKYGINTHREIEDEDDG